MDISELANLSLSPKNIPNLLSLSPPEKTGLTSASPDELSLVCQAFHAMWMDLLVHIPSVAKLKEELPDDDPVSKLDTAEFENILLHHIANYYDFCFYRLVVEQGHDDLPHGINFSDLETLFPSEGIDACRDKNNMVNRMISAEYFQALIALYFYDLLSKIPHLRGASPLRVFQSHLHNSLMILHRHEHSFGNKYRSTMISRWMSHLLLFTAKTYRFDRSHDPIPIGPFSSILLDELVPLARRDESAKSTFGPNHVSRAFEQQVALIMQTFGFYVATNQTGVKVVDLICISSHPNDRTTFLVEAKTSKHNYSLPSSDRRAIEEYVADAREILATIPPISLLLIVGPQPSQTLDTKLEQLENSINLPVRYVPAQTLALLRQRVPGPLPAQFLRNKLLEGPRVVDSGFVDRIAESYQMKAKAHTQLVESLLASEGIGEPPKGWHGTETGSEN